MVTLDIFDKILLFESGETEQFHAHTQETIVYFAIFHKQNCLVNRSYGNEVGLYLPP